MKSRYTPIVWSIVYLLLLLSLLTPFSILSVFCIVVPAAILYATLDVKRFLFHVAPIWIVIGIMAPALLLLAIYLIIPAITMGNCYKKRSSALRTVMTGAGTILVEMLLLLAFSTLFLEFNLADYVYDMVNMMMVPLKDISELNLLGSSDIELISSATLQRVPFALILSSFIMAAVTQLIARPVMNRMGYAVPKMKPIREWMLPKSLIWYYVLGFILNVIALSSDSSSMQMIAVNMQQILSILFTIQAVSFFFYVGYIRHWNPVLPFLTIIPILMFPPLSIIGILDIAFPLRQRMTKSK